MAFYQLPFVKFLRLNSIGAIIILIIYLIFNDLNVINMQISKVNVPPFPNNPGIKKIDVGQGEDFWILTYDDKLYHWISVRSELLYVRSDVLDFTIGSDGIVFCIQKDNKIYIRNYYLNAWNQIDDGSYYFSNKISACSYKTIYTINDNNRLIKGVYDINSNTYNWEYVDNSRYYYVSCAPDNSLWIIGPDSYVYLYVNYFIRVPVAEIVFKQIKALHEKYVIGIDYYDNLWEYNSGTWIQIRSNVKSATINYLGVIYVIDNDNLNF